jgi:hypothetical protein|tara:strand:+ start:920 stop:1324 length:405 start_codon:yes stop_codon:yes gene_type:complete
MVEDVQSLSLATILKIVGTIPILLGLMIIFNPTGSLVNGEKLADSGLMIGRYVGLLAIIFGISHWVVSIFTTENLHLFARFFAIGHISIGGMDFWNYFRGNVEFDSASIVGSIFPFALALLLLLNSKSPAIEEE